MKYLYLLNTLLIFYFISPCLSISMEKENIKNYYVAYGENKEFGCTLQKQDICSNRGKCTNTGICICSEGYVGINCEKCI